MDYKEALKLAKENREEGFLFLYEQTYKSKYYLALQYMKNEEAAKDVLQEAYMRAFSRLDTLERPEAFPAWLGIIVGNTAKNMLQKKNPMLFSDIEGNDDGEFLAYEIEDEHVENQPELSYSRQETQMLVREMIDSLSEEQRVCILMYEIEGIPIREIAAALNCSENTVKSRLNYGRKNLKAQAEKLQKKGYKLYGIAPVALLLLLLHTDEECWAAEGKFAIEKTQMAGRLFKTFRNRSVSGNLQNYGQNPQINDGHPQHSGLGPDRTPPGKMPGSEAQSVSRATSAGAKAAAKAVKTGFIHTLTGKLAIVAVILAVVCGGVYYSIYRVYTQEIKPDSNINYAAGEMAVTGAAQYSPDTQEALEETIFETEDAAVFESEEVPEETVQETTKQPQRMEDSDYETLIAGQLTKAEMEFVLAYGPEEIPEQGFSDSDYMDFINTFCQAKMNGVTFVESYGYNDRWQSRYSAADVNRLLSSFTTYQFTEDNDSDTEYGVNIEGSEIVYSPATLGHEASAEIVYGEYTDAEMNLYYSFNYHSLDTAGGRQEQSNKKAVLAPGEDGKYRIIRIEIVDESLDAQTQGAADETAGAGTAPDDYAAQESGGSQEGGQSIREVYESALQSVKNQENGYTFTSGVQMTGNIEYFLQDMDGDGIPELLIGAECEVDTFYGTMLRAYSCQKEGDGYTLKMIDGELITLNLYRAQDGNGLFEQEASRGTGDIYLYRITIQNDTLTKASEPEYHFMIGDTAMAEFGNTNPIPAWTDISSMDGLAVLE